MRSLNGPLKLFVGDLGDNRKSDLNRLFSKYGEISAICFEENKRFAFVEFASSNDAQRALENTNNKTLNGSKLRVEYAKSDKIPRDNRRPLSRDRSPTSVLYSHLQVTANRLPPMQVFRQTYHQQYPSTMLSNSTTTSRGRSLTPPSFKQNPRLPSSMHHLRTQDLYYHQPSIYSDSNYYGTYGDPYLMQRLPPPLAFLPSTSPSRSYRNMYSSSGMDRYSTNLSTLQHHRRSRSRRRSSPSRRNRSGRERKRKRRTSASSPPPQHRGPRTPPPSKSSTHRSRKRSRSGSDAVPSIFEQKSSSNPSFDDENNEEKRSNSRRSPDNNSTRKHLKRKTRE